MKLILEGRVLLLLVVVVVIVVVAFRFTSFIPNDIMQLAK